jgi:hypothetical protein
MVQALVELFYATNGPTWAHGTNWLIGEPCVNGWYGVLCCPLSHPLLGSAGADAMRCFATDRGGTTSSNGTSSSRRLSVATSVPVVNASEPGGRCVTGVITGTDADYALCAVVGLALSNNNLTGRLPPASSALPTSLDPPAHRGERGLRDLQSLDVRGNTLRGPLPEWLATLQLSAVRLMGGNVFDCTRLPTKQNGPSCVRVPSSHRVCVCPAIAMMTVGRSVFTLCR